MEVQFLLGAPCKNTGTIRCFYILIKTQPTSIALEIRVSLSNMQQHVVYNMSNTCSEKNTRHRTSCLKISSIKLFTSERKPTGDIASTVDTKRGDRVTPMDNSFTCVQFLFRKNHIATQKHPHIHLDTHSGSAYLPQQKSAYVSKYTTKKRTRLATSSFWWTRGDSNPSPLQCECSALPNELLAHDACARQCELQAQKEYAKKEEQARVKT
jgi:hypothetical protein